VFTHSGPCHKGKLYGKPIEMVSNFEYISNFTTLAESGKPITAGKSQCKRELLKSMQNKSKV